MKNLESLALRRRENVLEILDQQLLPHQEVWLKISNVPQMIEAIRALKVRGAPLIGVAASIALAQSAQQGQSHAELQKEAAALYEARPTAVNLMICMDRLKKILAQDLSQQACTQALDEMATTIFFEDVALCDRIATNGAALIKDGDRILTHCNTGGLATAGVGTALGILRKAHEQGKKIHVYVDETRPLWQGARLTAWELQKLGIPHTLITDSMAGHLMSLGRIDKAFVGADRIAMNGDFANKIGTYSVAVLSHHHRLPFYVAAPMTTLDPECANGSQIPIEQRDGQEVRGTWGAPLSPTYNPAFDVTPAHLVQGWILDSGVYTQTQVQQGHLKTISQKGLSTC